mmetsp:Transcript_15242/g.45142  ORF Transcript_15242/g.45142 Transcript_15242/m.45142 type:complete len:240 (+) Transcript_15242:1883-2602(+)
MMVRWSSPLTRRGRRSRVWISECRICLWREVHHASIAAGRHGLVEEVRVPRDRYYCYIVASWKPARLSRRRWWPRRIHELRVVINTIFHWVDRHAALLVRELMPLLLLLVQEEPVLSVLVRRCLLRRAVALNACWNSSGGSGASQSACRRYLSYCLRLERCHLGRCGRRGLRQRRRWLQREMRREVAGKPVHCPNLRGRGHLRLVPGQNAHSKDWGRSARKVLLYHVDDGPRPLLGRRG